MLPLLISVILAYLNTIENILAHFKPLLILCSTPAHYLVLKSSLQSYSREAAIIP